MNAREMKPSELGLMLTEERVVVSSRDVAKHFGRSHDNVLRAVRSLECSDTFNALNFEGVEYQDAKGETRPEYLMTKNGFIFLVMGFTGKEAARVKEAYISAFDEMERMIRLGHSCPVMPAQEFQRNLLEERVSGIYYATPLVHNFVVDCCMSVPNFLLSRQDFYKYFTRYCLSQGAQAPTRTSAVRAMCDLGYFREFRSSDTRYWKGVRLLTPDEWPKRYKALN